VPNAAPFSLTRRVRSFRFAWRGLVGVARSQHNAWIHASATVVTVAAGLWFGLERVEWALLVVTIAAVWTAEAFNTAIEALGNAVSPEHHPIVAVAKDAAAGAVLIAAVGAFVIGVLVFGPRVLHALGLVGT
jgi:diacylglycerol kinase (ATP)